MEDKYANRQNMHLTVQNLLDNDKFQPVWKDQKPLAFTKAAAKFSTLVQALTLHIAEQQAATIGYAQAKATEEEELETICHDIGQNLAQWLEENGRDGEAAQIDLTPTDWDRLRDTELLAKAKLLHKHLTAALETDAEALADLDLTAADAAQLDKETGDFERIIADPSGAISRRRALTLALRPKFREVAEHLKKMDRHVIRFRRTPAGQAFAEAWATSRIIRDLGGSAPNDEAPEPPTEPPTPTV